MTQSRDNNIDNKAELTYSRSESISGLEADIAFVEARQALLANEPETLYRDAQSRVYDSLKHQLQNQLTALRERLEAHQKLKQDI